MYCFRCRIKYTHQLQKVPTLAEAEAVPNDVVSLPTGHYIPSDKNSLKPTTAAPKKFQARIKIKKQYEVRINTDADKFEI